MHQLLLPCIIILLSLCATLIAINYFFYKLRACGKLAVDRMQEEVDAILVEFTGSISKLYSKMDAVKLQRAIEPNDTFN